MCVCVLLIAIVAALPDIASAIASAHQNLERNLFTHSSMSSHFHYMDPETTVPVLSALCFARGSSTSETRPRGVRAFGGSVDPLRRITVSVSLSATRESGIAFAMSKAESSISYHRRGCVLRWEHGWKSTPPGPGKVHLSLLQDRGFLGILGSLRTTE